MELAIFIPGGDIPIFTRCCNILRISPGSIITAIILISDWHFGQLKGELHKPLPEALPTLRAALRAPPASGMQSVSPFRIARYQYLLSQFRLCYPRYQDVHSSNPVSPVSGKGTFCPSYLYMSLKRREATFVTRDDIINFGVNSISILANVSVEHTVE